MKEKMIVNNIFFGFLSQIVAIILGIVIPRMLIVNFGSETNGLISSVGQIFIYFALFEAGVGTAALIALYGPVAKDDKKTINEILSATSFFYKRTGIFYLIGIVAFAIIYPLVVPSGINNVTVVSIIILTGIVGVINYFFQGKYCILLQAEGKSYIITNIRMAVTILTNIAKIILLLKGFDIVAVQSAYVACNLIQLVYIYYYINKYYKWINLNVKPDLKAISKKNSVFIHQISTLIFSNTDIIILTAFTNLKVVSVYALYLLLFGAVGTAIGTLSNSFAFVLGQTYNTDVKKFKKMFDAFELYFLALVFAAYTIAYVFILPFLKVYTRGITDISYIDKYMPILFLIAMLLTCCRIASGQVINFAGHFKQTQWRSILESSINLGCSLIFVNIIGIYGVLIGTILALLYRTNDIIIYANKHILHRKNWCTYKKLIINTCLLILVVFVSNIISINLNSFLKIILWAFVYILIVVPLFIFINLLFEKEIYKNSAEFILPYVRKLIKKPIETKV